MSQSYAQKYKVMYINMTKTKHLILGAGASGLSLAILVQDSLVIDQSSSPGGHARSLVDDSWVFDRGPHIIFSRNKLLLELIVRSLGANIHECKRKNIVCVKDKTLRYPIENDLGCLDPVDKLATLLDFVQTRVDQLHHSEVRNLEEWFETRFGKSLTGIYFRPYNEKLWKTPLKNLSMLWADRIPNPPLEDVMKGALGTPVDGYLHQLYYQYPKHGGYSALMSSWSSGIDVNRLRLGLQVKKIENVKSGLRTQFWKGPDVTCEQLVSSIPLRSLVKVIENCEPKIRQLVESLPVNPMRIITLGIKGEDVNNYTAAYVPDPAVPFNRVSFPKVFSPFNAPPGHYLVQVEITFAPGETSKVLDEDALVKLTKQQLLDLRLISDGEVVRSWVHDFEDAYVVYPDHYVDSIGEIKDYFASRGVHIHGRFGAHEYLNVDGCLQRSIEMAERLGYVYKESELLEIFSGLGQRHAPTH